MAESVDETYEPVKPMAMPKDHVEPELGRTGPNQWDKPCAGVTCGLPSVQPHEEFYWSLLRGIPT